MSEPRPNSDAVAQFRDTLTLRLGWRFASHDDARLGEVLEERRRARGLGHPDEYLEQLPEDGAELVELARALTITETYFLRNPDQFRVLEGILRDHAAAGRRHLRILSAGCSSGAEAHSVAIVAQDVAREQSGLTVSVHGIDVNPDVVEAARRGVYAEWALRGVPPAVIRRCFARRGSAYEVVEQVRAMVRFEVRNLVDDDPGFWTDAGFDVIFCRNVLMYFERNAARSIVARCSRALVDGGHLFLGHAENLRGLSREFELIHRGDAFFYRRLPRGATIASAGERSWPDSSVEVAWRSPSPTDEMAPPDCAPAWPASIAASSERIASLDATARSPTLARSAPRTEAPPRRDALAWEQSVRLMAAERFDEALDLARGTSEPSSSPELLLVRAAASLALGDFDEAEALARRIVELADLDPGGHYLLGLTREHAGDVDTAIEHHRIAAYLDPEFGMAHLQLGRLARRRGEITEARRELTLAASLLPTEDSARLGLFGGGFGRDSLVSLCEAELAACTRRQP